MSSSTSLVGTTPAAASATSAECQAASFLDASLAYWRQNHDAFLDGLKRFLAIPSISALPEHRQDVAACAKFIADELSAMGMHEVEIIPGEGDAHPLVYAEWMGAPGKPTLLFYNHYDVQPVDPLNKWISSPFDAQVRGDKLYARGSSDDKGQLYIVLKVLEGFFKTHGRLPVNVKILFEGEEESDGSHIDSYVRANPKKLEASAVVILDMGLFTPGCPTLTTGLRGIICAEITCQGAKTDLHSGQYGGAAPNAVDELAKILAQLKTPSGRVRIPRFYDRVIKPTTLEMETWKRLPFDQAKFLSHEIGAPALTGDTRFSVLHRLFARPTLDTNGINGGFAGAGFKTIIPAVASAKVSMRIVPDMQPDEIGAAFKSFVESLAPPCVKVDVNVMSGSPGMVVSTDNAFMRAAAEALQQTYGTKPLYVRDGASIPIASTFQEVLKLPVILTGFVLPDCNMHAPNESLSLPDFYAGIEAIGRYMDLLSK